MGLSQLAFMLLYSLTCSCFNIIKNLIFGVCFRHKWGWIGTINRFLRAVQELAGRLLQPKEYQLKEVERFQEEKVRKAARKRKPIKQFDPTVPEEQEDDGVYTHLCLHFGKMFFFWIQGTKFLKLLFNVCKLTKALLYFSNTKMSE